MSDNRKVAAKLMVEAGETILKKRPGVHGSAELSFEMIGDLWTVYLRHARKVRGNDTIQPTDVAEMMSMLKKARKMYGDTLNVDNDVDDLGYTALAGMLRLPDITKPKEEQVNENLDKLDPLQGEAKSDHEHIWVADPDDTDKEMCIFNGCKVRRKKTIVMKHTDIKS